jgi:hypothetical protein
VQRRVVKQNGMPGMSGVSDCVLYARSGRVDRYVDDGRPLYSIVSQHVCLCVIAYLLRSIHRLPDFGRKPCRMKFCGVIKAALFLCLITHRALKVYGGVEVHLHAFVTSELDGRPWSASLPRPLYSRKKTAGS